MTFQELGLSPELGDIINQLGYSTPTPIQSQSIPAILQGRDVLACAETGTGKTGAFLLPTIEILQNSRSRQGLPSAIVIVPTRELATQVFDNFNAYAAVIGGARTLKAISIVGGEVISSQERMLKKGVDMIIATPGRLIDMLERGKIICTNVKVVILDEADRMLDMGFMPDVDRILSSLPKLRQTLLFSATVPEEVRKISQLYQINPKEIKISRSAKTSDLIEQRILRLSEGQKQQALKQLLSENDSKEPVIVFCNRKLEINGLTRFLVNCGFSAESLHGDMSQRNRNEALERFRGGQFRVLVTSDVAARGIDINGISLVVNYNVPIHVEDYVHRIGRTGRAGQEGRAIMFVMKAEEKKLQNIQKLIKTTIAEMFLEIAAGAALPDEKSAEKRDSRKRTPVKNDQEPRSEKTVETERRDHSSRNVRNTRNPDTRNADTRNRQPQENSSSQEVIVGFGNNLPAFMLNDPLKGL